LNKEEEDPEEVADLIVSPQAETLLRGNYVNKRGVRGYFVQIKVAIIGVKSPSLTQITIQPA
jgi:hypothetical protein